MENQPYQLILICWAKYVLQNIYASKKEYTTLETTKLINSINLVCMS